MDGVCKGSGEVVFAANSPVICGSHIRSQHGGDIPKAISMKLGNGMMMNTNTMYQDAHHTDTTSTDRQYDSYLYAEYGIEW